MKRRTRKGEEPSNRSNNRQEEKLFNVGSLDVVMSKIKICIIIFEWLMLYVNKFEGIGVAIIYLLKDSLNRSKV